MDLEEERRLCYVGITRAMSRLTITRAAMRMNRGETQYYRLSRFVSEIPSGLFDLGGKKPGGRLLRQRRQRLRRKQPGIFPAGENGLPNQGKL